MNFNFIWTFENLNFHIGVGYFQHTPNQHVTFKNEKLDLGILLTFGTTFGVRVRVGYFTIPPTMNVTPKNEKLDLGIL